MAASAAPAGMRMKSMQRVPGRIQPGNLVGEEFDEQHHAGGAEYQRVLQQVQSRRQHHQAGIAGRANNEHHGVKPQTGGPAEAGGKCQKTGKIQRQMGDVHGLCSAFGKNPFRCHYNGCRRRFSSMAPSPQAIRKYFRHRM
jgi:hypothetical protein